MIRKFLTVRVGRRGAALLMFAFIDAVYSYSFLNPTPEQRRFTALRFLADIAPLWFFGLLWGAAGIVCFVSAFRRHDRWGFAAAMGIKVLWGLLFVWAAAAGVSRAYVSAALWLAVAGWVGIISTWPEPPSARDRR